MPRGIFERTEHHRENYRQAAIKVWACPRYREKMRKINKEVSNRPEERKRQSDAMIEAHNRPEFKKNHIEAMYRPEVTKKMRKAATKSWQKAEFIRKQMKARNVKPNKIELIFNDLLQGIFPNEYKFVGDGEFILAGKCPDFININGQKKIIELYGTYWHRGQIGQDRIDLFSQYGYKTLIVWENELKNENILKKKLLNFNEMLA